MAAPIRASVRCHSSSFTSSDTYTDSKALGSSDSNFEFKKLSTFGDAQDVMLAGFDVIVLLDFVDEVMLRGVDVVVVLCMAVVLCVDSGVEFSNLEVLESSDVEDDESTVDKVLHDDVEVELSAGDVAELSLLLELEEWVVEEGRALRARRDREPEEFAWEDVNTEDEDAMDEDDEETEDEELFAYTVSGTTEKSAMPMVWFQSDKGMPHSS